MKAWDDDGNLRIPPTAPSVEDKPRVILYDSKGRPLIRPFGFQRKTKK